jgi:hypothetical protein
MTEWIRVGDVMPTEGVRVILTDAIEVFVGRYAGFGFVDDDGVMAMDGDITHWMPLPKPPNSRYSE